MADNPSVYHDTIFSAIAVSTTKTLAETPDLGRSHLARSIWLEINGGSTPNWTLDIQGRATPDATWHNIDFFRVDQGSGVTLSAAQLTVNWSTAQYYVIPNPPPFVRLVGVRTGGTLTVHASFSSAGFAYPPASGTAQTVGGPVAEDAAASGNPVPMGGRYDETPRTLEDGDRGEIATNSAGHVIVATRIKVISVTKALASAGDYAAEDVLSESASAGTSWTFTGAARAAGLGGTITKAIALSESTGLTFGVTLFLFNAVPTSALNDNVANTAVLHADQAGYQGRIDFPALSEYGGDSESVATPSTLGNLPLEFVTAADANLYGICITRDAITGETATNDLVIRLHIRVD